MTRPATDFAVTLPPSPMNPALDAANFKLSRSTEHLHTLTEEMNAFRERDPYQITVNLEADGWWVARVRITEEPSPLFSVLVGEIAYECLSALNHLVWELAARKIGRTKVASRPLRKSVQFPVAQSPSDWRKIRLVKDGLVSKQALVVIESLQPYHGSRGPEGAAEHPLVLIKDIADSDKHRVLAAAFASAEFSDVRWRWDSEHADGAEWEWLARPGRTLPDGSPLARIRFERGNAEADVRVEGKRAPDVLFNTDHWAVGHRQLLTCTVWAKKAWATLAPLFPPK